MRPISGLTAGLGAAVVVLLMSLLLGVVGASAAAALQPDGSSHPMEQPAQPSAPLSDVTVLVEAAIRLPAASLLGAALAFRPRRRGTPARNPAVIQTQILLAVVGALVMMVVGASLARAFGIVGAAGLIRYRAKIDDPKDAGVMLATLGVGLAAGVGYYFLAGFATLFFLVMLGVVESLDEGHKLFELTLEGEQVQRVRGDVEALLRRQGVEFELRSSAEASLCYAVRLPLSRKTDRLSSGIQRLARGGPPLAIRWEERKVK